MTVDADGACGFAGAGFSAKALAASQETRLIGRTIGATGTFSFAGGGAGVAEEAFSAFFVGETGCCGGCAAFAEDNQATKQKQADQRPAQEKRSHGVVSSWSKRRNITRQTSTRYHRTRKKIECWRPFVTRMGWCWAREQRSVASILLRRLCLWCASVDATQRRAVGALW